MQLGLATPHVWSMPLLAMLLGTIAAVAAIVFVLRHQTTIRFDARSVLELEAQLDSHLAALRDLKEREERHAGHEGALEREALEKDAAAVYAELEALRLKTDRQAPEKLSNAKPRTKAGLAPQLKGALWGAGCTALGAFLLVTVQKDSSKRPEAAAPAPAMAPSQTVDSDAMAQAQKRLERDPNDVAALLDMSHQLLRAQMLDEARVLNERALRIRPMDLEALTHAAVLTASQGDVAGALAGLGMVLKKDPQFAEAWFFRGMLSMQSGDLTTMRASLTQFVRYAPDGPQKERARAMLQRAQSGAP